MPSGHLEMPMLWMLSMSTSPSKIAIGSGFVLWFFNCCDLCNVLQVRPTHGIKYIISSIHHRETWHPKVTIRRESSPCTHPPPSYSSCPCIILLSSSNAIDSKQPLVQMNGVSLKKQTSISPNAWNAANTNVVDFLNGTARCYIQCIRYESKSRENGKTRSMTVWPMRQWESMQSLKQRRWNHSIHNRHSALRLMWALGHSKIRRKTMAQFIPDILHWVR